LEILSPASKTAFARAEAVFLFVSIGKTAIPQKQKPLSPGAERLRNTKHKQTVTEKVTDIIIPNIQEMSIVFEPKIYFFCSCSINARPRPALV
jgi:hypothetical protein